jgi:hypothetical protein
MPKKTYVLCKIQHIVHCESLDLCALWRTSGFEKVQIHLSTKSGEVLEGRDAVQSEVTVFCHLGGSGLLRKAGG